MRESPILHLLRELKSKEDRAEERSAASRAQWIADLEALLAWIRKLLEPAVREGLACVESATVMVQKDAIGDYEAPALTITLPGQHIVWVRPIGTFAVGARGMVDVVCGPNRALLVMNRAGIWKVRGTKAERSGGKLEALDADHFTQVMRELVQ